MDIDRDYLQITFDTIDEGITIYDEDLKLVIWNKQYDSMGITPDELLYRGSSLIDSYLIMAKRGVFGEGDPNELAMQRIHALKHGPLIELEHLTASTNRSIRIKRFRLKNGGICATFLDVTEERRLESQLRQSNKLDALGRLSGGLAHDLNNVLSIIIGNLELAQLKPSDVGKHIQLSMDASERGASLVRSLLAFARQQTLKPSVTTVAESISKLDAMLDPLVRDYVTLEITSNDELWLVEIDMNQFEATLMNLVINARDASIRGGLISIDAFNVEIDQDEARLTGIASGEYVCVSVTDNGSGMEPAILENAIDPFFTTKSPGNGTGLGLSMAHGFVKQSNGYLKIFSEQGSGTRVNLYLPRSLLEPSGTVSTNDASKKLTDLRVLVVDDDEMVKESIVAQIRSFGCFVTSADSGSEAIANDDWDQIDVLVTDSVMPDVDGTTLAEIAISKNNNLKILLISGFLDESIHQKQLTYPIKEVLRKPFRLYELFNAISRVMNQS